MPAITDYPAFVIAILLFLAIPGPGNLAIISSTAQGRVRGGLASTFGIIAGDQILMWCAVAGVAALLKAYPAAFAAVLAPELTSSTPALVCWRAAELD